MNVLRPLAFLAFLGAAFAPAVAPAVESMPFTLVAGGVVVQASVDGRQPVPMVVDLAAGVDLLSSGLGNAVAFGVDRAYTTWLPDGTRIDVPMGDVVSLGLGDFSTADHSVGIWSGLDGTANQGIVSAMAFADVVTTFDFKADQLVFEDAASFAERKRTAVRVPFVVVDDRSIGLKIFARFDFGGGHRGLCAVDTGREDIAVDRRLAKAWGNAPIASIALQDAPDVRLANPNVATQNLIYDCVVGNAFWANRILTIDLPNRAMYLGGS